MHTPVIQWNLYFRACTEFYSYSNTLYYEQVTSIFVKIRQQFSVADPGFPIGGALTRWGDANLRCIHFSVKTYAITKEIDPVGGHMPAAPPPPGSANDFARSLGFKPRPVGHSQIFSPVL